MVSEAAYGNLRVALAVLIGSRKILHLGGAVSMTANA